MQDIEYYCQFFRKPISTKTKTCKTINQNKIKKKRKEKKKETTRIINPQ